ncbi:hypothetical protein GINT2_001712 [Glugoides intestinalis]
MRKYKLIALEGLDCSGKTTVSKILKERMQPSTLLRFPDRSSEIGVIIDKFLKKEIEVSSHSAHLLYSANRYEKVEEIKELLKHSHVICDRYWLSGAVYSTAKGLDYEWCKSSDRFLPEVDNLFFIDIPAKETAKRKGFGEEAHDKLELQEKVYAEYKKHLFNEGGVAIDGMKSPNEIADEILSFFSGIESGVESCVESGIESGIESGVESGVESCVESCVESGIESGSTAVNTAVNTTGVEAGEVSVTEVSLSEKHG